MNWFLLLSKELETAENQEYMTAGEVVSDIGKKTNAFIDYIKSHIDNIIGFGLKVIVAILLFAIGKFLIKIVMKICDRFFTRTGMEISVRKFLNSLIRVLLYLLLVVIVCSQVGIETTSFIAVLGSAGLALGLSLQGSLSNFAGGILILMIKPFVVGDYIIDGGTKVEGTVTRIDLFYTNLITVDNKKVVIPNGTLANSNITNLTAYDKRRIDLRVGIGYSSDIKKAKELLEKLAGEHKKILSDEEIGAFVYSLDESQITLELRVWVKTEDYWAVKFDLNERIKAEFDKNGIEIPFNQLEVHMK